MVGDSTFLFQKGQGWQRGFPNLFAKENRAWWRTRRWLVQAVVWLVVIDGLVALMLFAGAASAVTGGVQPQVLARAYGLQGLFEVGGLALAVGAVLLAHDQIVGERQNGVMEWILSKPATRPAYLLSKLAADLIGVIVLLIALPAALAYAAISIVTGPLPVGLYLIGVAGLTVHTLFYLSLTLMMGVFTTNRGKLLGVPLGVLLAGTFVGSFLMRLPLVGNLVLLTPWGLTYSLPATVLGASMPVPVWASIAVTATLAVVSLAVMLWKFKHLEF
jgi:ABC-type transport system involved in multi-copper enzyme maturation permease subunit